MPKRVSLWVGKMHRGGPVGIRLEAATEHGTLAWRTLSWFGSAHDLDLQPSDC